MVSRKINRSQERTTGIVGESKRRKTLLRMYTVPDEKGDSQYIRTQIHIKGQHRHLNLTIPSDLVYKLNGRTRSMMYNFKKRH